MNDAQFHNLIESLALIIPFLSFVVLLMVRNEQGRVKEELVAKQNEMREDMDQKHAENKKSLAVHMAEDEGTFALHKSEMASVNKTLTRIEAIVSGRGRR